MENFGYVALCAISLVDQKKTPEDAWRASLKQVVRPKFSIKTQGKSCPKVTFFSLVENGRVLINGKKTKISCNVDPKRSAKNIKYAIEATDLLLKLQSPKSYTPSELWKQLPSYRASLNHNGQMDVVLALYYAGRLV